jgi:hypothetical protein
VRGFEFVQFVNNVPEKRIKNSLENTNIGMTKIKLRRLEELEVNCHPGTKVGEYVPFYFCPRSIMLYILHMGNHQDIDYHEGQGPIVHLQADLISVTDWADQNQIRWAFSDRNAGTYIAQFYNNLDDLDLIDWLAVAATDFRNMVVKEGKQAEFLIYESFPLSLIEKIGVINTDVERRVNNILRDAASNMPVVSIERRWYY